MRKWRDMDRQMEPSSQMFTQGGIRNSDWFSDRLWKGQAGGGTGIQRQMWVRPSGQRRDVRVGGGAGKQTQEGTSGPTHVDRTYLLRALHISMVTSTDKAMVMGSGASKTSQSRPSNSGLCSVHCMK